MKANEFFKKVGIEAVKSYIVAYEDHLTDELKRLVESHELVEKWQGLEASKIKVNLLRYFGFHTQADQLQQAIADVESCMEVS